MRYQELLTAFHPARKFASPKDFVQAAAEYFAWCDNNPLTEEKLFSYQGDVTRADASKVRPFTKKGLCIFLGIPESRLQQYRSSSDEGWQDAMELVDMIIHNQKFENAAADLLNAGIISRDLGLADRTELTGRDGKPIQTEDTTPTQRLANRIASVTAKQGAAGIPGNAD